jgi:CubicO group peptidase (beta-lactamase class C family)
VRAGGFEERELFSIASVSKPLTAVAVLRLVDEGALSLEDTLSELLPAPEIERAENGVAAITVADLLSHRSGFTTTHGLVHSSDSVRESHYSLLAELDLHAASGTSYAYSNLNYRVLGLIVEERTGVPFAQFLESQVFRPFGLTSSIADHDQIDTRDLVAGYTQIFGLPVAVSWLSQDSEIASGGVVSTRDDLLRFLQILVTQDGPAPLSETLREAMWSPQIQITPDEAWGLGWQLDIIGSELLVSHGGDLPGYQATIMASPSREAGLVFLANANTIPLAFAGEFALEPIRTWVATGDAPSEIRLPRIRFLVTGLLLLLAYLITRDITGVVRAPERAEALLERARPRLGLALSQLPAVALPVGVLYIAGAGVLLDAFVMFPDAIALAIAGAAVAVIKIVRTTVLFARGRARKTLK